eukprot:CAMPEP_0119368128 /NCGR_PEP_ID=MMETSP1334-20130426/14823_1 /TAXON_ID=127549 /ORGANISM="Calcidiscus leptoporus, Strain RCC1130" /LENGTH=297 /DNA_ID=CAMNT_0007384699 /DNA_START=170 /DNA_END=1065 /DNA_ORIENTATION=+
MSSSLALFRQAPLARDTSFRTDFFAADFTRERGHTSAPSHSVHSICTGGGEKQLAVLAALEPLNNLRLAGNKLCELVVGVTELLVGSEQRVVVALVRFQPANAWAAAARNRGEDRRVVVQAARISARPVAQLKLHPDLGTSFDAQFDGLGVRVQAWRTPTDAAVGIVRVDIPDAARIARHAHLAALHGDLGAFFRRRRRERREDLLLLVPRHEARERDTVGSVDYLQPEEGSVVGGGDGGVVGGGDGKGGGELAHGMEVKTGALLYKQPVLLHVRSHNSSCTLILEPASMHSSTALA